MKFRKSHSQEWNYRKAGEGQSVLVRVFKGCILMPNIGYGSDKKIHHLGSRNLWSWSLQSVRAVIAHNVLAKKRNEIGERASQLDVFARNSLA
ncbi:hypothetical protein N665_0444s0005 [Sinapis alba]|nr:hypothetical protein N665_0444s0005 [Sinapis alba]